MCQSEYENKSIYQTELKCIYMYKYKGYSVCTEGISLVNEITRLLMPTSQFLFTINTCTCKLHVEKKAVQHDK